MEIIRRVRGVIGTALTWGTCWGLVGLVLSSIASRFIPASAHMPADLVLQATVRWALFGAVSGAAFAIALSLAERRARSLRALSMQRVSVWGAVGGAVLPLALLPVIAVVIPAAIGAGVGLAAFGSVLGAASAAGSLRLARRADESLPSLPGTPPQSPRDRALAP